MPAPHEIIPRLEGLMGLVAATGDVDTQELYQWIEACKRIMREPTRRNLDTWEFVFSADIDESANVVVSGACTLYALAIDYHDATTMETGSFGVRNVASTFTYDATAIATTDFFRTNSIPANAVTAISEFHCFTFVPGLVLGTGLTAGAEDNDGSTFGGDSLGAWFLYTDDS